MNIGASYRIKNPAEQTFCNQIGSCRCKSQIRCLVCCKWGEKNWGPDAARD